MVGEVPDPGGSAVKTPARLKSAERRIEELERRVRDLEARPVILWIVIQPAPAPMPQNPWPPLGPSYVGDPLPLPPTIHPLTVGIHDQTVPMFGAPGTFTC